MSESYDIAQVEDIMMNERQVSQMKVDNYTNTHGTTQHKDPKEKLEETKLMRLM